MDAPSDKRLFAMCLISAATGFVSWRVFGSDDGGGVMLPITVAVFAVLMFGDGYLQSAQGND